MNPRRNETGVRLGKTCLFVLVAAAVGYYYARQWTAVAPDLSGVRLAIDPPFLLLALGLNLLAYLVEAFVWRLVLGARSGGRTVPFRDLVTILWASGMFRYLPGRIWGYAAQFAWLKRYGVGKSLVLYINLVCIAGLVLTSAYLWLLYAAIHTDMLPAGAAVSLAALLLTANLLVNRHAGVVTDGVAALAARLFRADIRGIDMTASRMALIQGIIGCSWLLTGLSAYALARGTGLAFSPADTLPVTAAMSLSWVAGYAALFAPGGLGVREGVMLLMLKPLLALKTAVLLPILSRVLVLLSEALLGVVALVLGVRGRVFTAGDDD